MWKPFEVLAPREAVAVVLRQVAIREAATQPERRHIPVGCSQFKDVERPQIHMGNPAGEALARLAQQVH